MTDCINNNNIHQERCGKKDHNLNESGIKFSGLFNKLVKISSSKRSLRDGMSSENNSNSKEKKIAS